MAASPVRGARDVPMNKSILVVALAFACKPKPVADVAIVDTDVAERGGCPVDDGAYDDLAQLFEDDRKNWDAPGRTVAVFKDGEILWCAGLGSPNPKKKSEEMDPEALFRIASITKPITAIGVLQEVEKGTLDLNDTVPSIIGDWDFSKNQGWAEGMTVAHLLTQEAGIFDHLTIEGPTNKKALEDFVETELVRDWFMLASPGLMWNYSNDNFVVAGRLMEIADGRSYSDKITEDVLLPLGMDRTFFDPDDVLDDGNYVEAMGYDWDGVASERRVKPDSYDNGWARPAGYAWSSVADLARMGMWVMDGDEAILGDELRNEMQEPMADLLMPKPGISAYGYGWFSDVGIQTTDGLIEVPTVYHMGDMPGFAADLYLYPGENLGIAVLTSADAAHAGPDVLAEAVATFTELPGPVDMGIDVTDMDLTRYEGEFDDQYTVGRMEFYVDGDALKIDLPEMDAMGLAYGRTLIPFGPDNFYINIFGYYLQLTFIEEDGEYRWARNRYFVGEAEGGDAPNARVHQPDPIRLLERLERLGPARRSPFGR